jgi:hypothetical protein
MISSLENRFFLLRLLTWAVIGVCLGAIIGGLAFAAIGTDTTATAFLRLRNPADLSAIAGGANQLTPDNQGNTSEFVAGEIAYLSGEGFAQAVSKKMAKDEPVELTVAQEGESPVITISSSSTSGDDSIRTVQVAIDLYRQQLAQRVDNQLRTILPALAEWEQRDTADATRMQELRQLRESIELQAATAGTLLVVQPPTPNQPSTHQWLIGVILGALLGGSGAAAILFARRRAAGSEPLVKTMTTYVNGVVVPAVDLDAIADDSRGHERARLGRTLYAQCRSAEPAREILVIGASSASGSVIVASLLQIAAGEIKPAALPSGQHWSPTTAGPATTRVVSGGVVGDPALTPDSIGAATDIVLVARIDVDTTTQALALISATSSSAAPVVAVFTYRRPLTARFRKRRTSPESAAAPPNVGGVGREPGSQ